MILFLDSNPNYTDIITAFSTLVGVIVAIIAIFSPSIIKNYSCPKLKLSFKKFDESLFTPTTFENLNKKDIPKQGFSLKLDVFNYGKSEAKNVQIALNKITCNGISKPVAPLKLRWSYQDERIKLKLPYKIKNSILAGSHAHCDFLFIFKNSCVCTVKLVSQVDQFNYLITSGFYQILLTVGAKDIKTTFWMVSFYLNKNTVKKEEIIRNFNIIKI